jgi:hypothetical protein
MRRIVIAASVAERFDFRYGGASNGCSTPPQQLHLQSQHFYSHENALSHTKRRELNPHLNRSDRAATMKPEFGPATRGLQFE